MNLWIPTWICEFVHEFVNSYMNLWIRTWIWVSKINQFWKNSKWNISGDFQTSWNSSGRLQKGKISWHRYICIVAGHLWLTTHPTPHLTQQRKSSFKNVVICVSATTVTYCNTAATKIPQDFTSSFLMGVVGTTDKATFSAISLPFIVFKLHNEHSPGISSQYQFVVALTFFSPLQNDKWT